MIYKNVVFKENYSLSLSLSQRLSLSLSQRQCLSLSQRQPQP